MQTAKKSTEMPRKHPADDHVQLCPVCGSLISAVAGSKAAICGNCGFKDSCC